MIKILASYIEGCLLEVEQPMAMSEVQYSEEFLTIEAEIQKLQGLEMLVPNWDLILEMSKTILSSQAKHLKVVTYAIVALYKKHRAQGLLAGLYLLSQIFEREGDDLLPNAKRKKSRPSLITWMVKFISDYREMADVGLTIEDIELLSSAPELVNNWYDLCHPDENPQPLLAIYDWFERKKLDMLQTQNNSEVVVDVIQDEINDFYEDVNISDEWTENSADEVHSETNKIESIEPILDEATHVPVNVTSFDEVRYFMVEQLLEQLNDCESDMHAVHALMQQTRKIMWNMLYYADIDGYFESSQVSDDFIYLHDILSIDDITTKLAQLEKLFIGNPFLLEIQFYICETLKSAYMKTGDEQYQHIYHHILQECQQLIYQLPSILEQYIEQKRCLPSYLYDWIFTEVFAQGPSVLDEVLNEYLEGFSENTKIQKLTQMMVQSRTLETKLYFLRITINMLQDQVSASELIAFIEKHASDNVIFGDLLQNSRVLKSIYETLLEQYQTIDPENEMPIYVDKCQNILKKLYG